MSRHLGAALDYLGRGWSVIPVSARGKVPLLPWSDYSTRLPTEQEVRDWWEEYPTANVGIVTGAVSGVVVVDIDVGRGGEPRPVYDEAPTDLISKTGSGGWHLFYRHPGGRIPNSVTEEGIDVRGDGGFVVAPPSVHPNGTDYVWAKSGEPGEALPAAIVGPRMPAGGLPAPGGTMDKWLSTLMQGVGSGSRNQSAAKLIGYLASKGIPQDVAEQILSLWNTKNNPPIPNHELLRTVESVYNTAKRSAERFFDSVYFDEEEEEEEPAALIIPDTATPKADQPKFELMDWSGFLGFYSGRSEDWLIPEWLPNKTICFSVSPPEGYKTWLNLDLAVSVATGKPFLGIAPVMEPGPVIVIQQEDYHGQIAERVQTIVAARFGIGGVGKLNGDGVFDIPIIPGDLPIHFHTRRQFRFDDDEIIGSFIDQVAKIRPKLVIIDPLYYATGGFDDYMASAVEQMKVLKWLRDRYDVSFHLSHHTAKRQSATEREGAWGSQFLNAFLESGWQIRHTDTPGQMLIRRHFKTGPGFGDTTLRFNIDTAGELTYAVELGAVAEAPVGSVDTEVQSRTVSATLESGPQTIAELEAATGLPRENLVRTLMFLQEKNIVDRGPDKRYRLVGTMTMF